MDNRINITLLSSIKFYVHRNMGFANIAHCSTEHALLNIVGKIQIYGRKIFFLQHFH